MLQVFSQSKKDSLDGSWNVAGYAEIFLSFSPFGNRNSRISDFQFNHNRYNSPDINQANISVDHKGRNLRMQLAFQGGTYVKDNYAAEPAVLRPFYKCFLGFSVNRRKNIWLDAGVFPSYIGSEGIDAFENPTLTRSLAAENSPYYLTGFRMNHPLGGKSELSYYLLTGWQRIVPVKGNSLPALGFQWIRRLRNDNRLNWSFFAGSDYPDSLRRMRYFNNFFWQGSGGKWWYSFGVDIGFEQKSKRSEEYNGWWSPVLIARYSISEKWKTTFRFEHYGDKSGVIARPASGFPLITTGYSVNMDYSPLSFLLCRVEWRNLKSTKDVFPFGDIYRRNSGYFTFSLAFRFEKSI